MDDAVPCDRHMSLSTFKDCMDFFNKYGGIECVITGGEPTDNPDWMDIVQYAVGTIKGSSGTGIAHVTLTTNAMNIVNNEEAQKFLSYLDRRYNKKLSLQITHIDDLYPIDVDFSEPFFKNMTIIHELTSMYPMGRALKNNLSWSSKCSKCFNIRSAVRFHHKLDTATLLLASKLKFCTPQIDYQGYIKLGESCLCPKVSSIYKPIEDIIDDICNFTCRKCDMINKNLSDAQLEAIGEKRENIR
jgi:hypothetical protein